MQVRKKAGGGEQNEQTHKCGGKHSTWRQTSTWFALRRVQPKWNRKFPYLIEIILIKNYKEQVMLKDLGYEGYCKILNREVI